MKKYFLYALYVIIGGGLVLGLVQVILLGYSASWTGFGEYITSKGDIVQSKKLWDWMELLIVPFVLAGGALYLNRSERAVERQIAENRVKEDRQLAEDRAKLEREIALDRQQEAALQSYIDRMAELLLKEKLRTTEVEEVRDVARIRTVTVMRGLDSKRNNLVIQFLLEANLIIDGNSILNGAHMEGTNLQGVNLTSIHLQKAFLSNAHLEGAFLVGAHLEGAYLADANLTGADLVLTNLEGAFLVGAELQGADLQDANLTGVELRYANLRDAKNITNEQIAQIKSLEGAIMQDGTKHE